MKRFIAINIVLVCSIISVFCQTIVQNNLIYVVIEGTKEVSVGSLRIISPIEFNIPSKIINTPYNDEYTVTTVRKDAFNGCQGLTAISLPNTITSIGDNAFEGCNQLKSIYIPSSVITIGNSVFNGCYSLEEINVDDNNNNYSSDIGVLYNKEKTKLIRCPSGKTGDFSISNSVLEIEPKSFYFCGKLTSITIPGSIEKISDMAFWNCNSLIYAVISEGVQTIGYSTFYNCNNLKEIVIPQSISTIERGAFTFCKSLNSIKVKWIEPEKLIYKTDIFDYVDVKNITLHVPISTSYKYAMLPIWRNFIIKESDETHLKIIQDESMKISILNGKLNIICEKKCNLSIYSISGIIFRFNIIEGLNEISLPKGIYVVDGKKIKI